MTVPLPSLTETLLPIAEALDALSHKERVNWMRGLSRRELRTLFTLSEQAPPLPLSFFHGSPDEIIVHTGQNSLLAFSTFEKRIVLRGDIVQGFNQTSPLVRRIVGPGHFTLRQADGEVWFDYTQLPPNAPAGFPALQDNTAGSAKWVFGDMVDRVRRVSKHCTIGRAYRRDKPENAWFMLVRNEASPD